MKTNKEKSKFAKFAESKGMSVSEAAKYIIDNEHSFHSPSEKEKIVKHFGEEILEMLAPNADEMSDDEYNEIEEHHMAHGGELTPEKAHQMLKDGTANGHPLTPAQRRYFGYIYGSQGKAEGGTIEIPKSHRGMFTAWAKEHGMSVAEAASHVMANKDKYSPHTVKMAVFAHNFTGKCMGGMVKKYAEGGEVDGNDPKLSPREEFAKILQEEKNQAKSVADKQRMAQYEKILSRIEQGKEITKAQEKDLQSAADTYNRNKELDKQNINNAYADKVKKANTDLENNLSVYKKYADAIKNYTPGKGAYTLSELKEKQKEFLQKAIKSENELASYDTKPSNKTTATVSKNVGPSFGDVVNEGMKKQKELNAINQVANKEIPSKSGAEIEKALGNVPSNTSKPKVGVNKYVPPIGETSDTQVPVTQNQTPQTQQEKSLVDSALKEEQNIAGQQQVEQARQQAQNAKNRQAITKGLGMLGDQISGLGNYFLPFQQYKLGQQFLAQSGQRPKGNIDPDFLRSVQTAQANAKFGFTPEEQALVQQQNINALRAGQGAAQNYSGGSASNAYNMTRDAANQYYSRGLQNALANKNLQFSKQQYADQLNLDKQNLNRQLFQDNLNAWQQQQAAGGNLVGMGLSNALGAQRYNQEAQFQRQYAQNNNPWTQGYFNSINP